MVPDHHQPLEAWRGPGLVPLAMGQAGEEGLDARAPQEGHGGLSCDPEFCAEALTWRTRGDCLQVLWR